MFLLYYYLNQPLQRFKRCKGKGRNLSNVVALYLRSDMFHDLLRKLIKQSIFNGPSSKPKPHFNIAD